MNIDWQRDAEGTATGATTNATFKTKNENGNSKLKLDGGNVTYEKELTPASWKQE